MRICGNVLCLLFRREIACSNCRLDHFEVVHEQSREAGRFWSDLIWEFVDLRRPISYVVCSWHFWWSTWILRDSGSSERTERQVKGCIKMDEIFLIEFGSRDAVNSSSAGSFGKLIWPSNLLTKSLSRPALVIPTNRFWDSRCDCVNKWKKLPLSDACLVLYIWIKIHW